MQNGVSCQRKKSIPLQCCQRSEDVSRNKNCPSLWISKTYSGKTCSGTGPKPVQRESTSGWCCTDSESFVTHTEKKFVTFFNKTKGLFFDSRVFRDLSCARSHTMLFFCLLPPPSQFFAAQLLIFAKTCDDELIAELPPFKKNSAAFESKRKK